MKIFLAALFLAFATTVVIAAPDGPVRDLGLGLGYIRVHALPADLPPTGETPRGALVLDLRFSHGDDNSATPLAAWLRSHCTTATPVFVLVNDETAPAALAYFSAHDPSAGLVTLGAASARFKPDIVLTITPASDWTAYNAADHGTALLSLLTAASTKPRHDEASIAQDQKAAVEDPASSDTDLPDPGEPPPAVHAPPPPLLDLVLLRAVHLHRALLALKKI